MSVRQQRQSYPVRIWKGGREHLIGITNGNPVTFEDPNSEFALSVNEGVKEVIAQSIHPNFSAIRSILPAKECIISPPIHFSTYTLAESKDPALMEHDVDQNKEKRRYKYQVTLPHCAPNDVDFEHIRVRYGNILKPESLKEAARTPTDERLPYFEVHPRFITLYTNHFCVWICSSEKKICDKKLQILVYGNLRDHTEETYAKIKVFLGNYLYERRDMRKVHSW